MKPKLLVWARKSAGLTLEAAASRTKLEAEVLEAWELGDVAPSLAQLAANAIAAATLLPADGFAKVAAHYRGAASGEDDSLRLLAQRVKVSPEVILRRLVTLHQASAGVYRTKRDAWGKTTWYVKASTGGAIPMQVKTLASAGRGYTRLVLNAYDQRLISTSAASDYLGVKPRHFNNIRRELTRSVTCPNEAAPQVFKAGLSGGFLADCPSLSDRGGGCDVGPAIEPGVDGFLEPLKPLMRQVWAGGCTRQPS